MHKKILINYSLTFVIKTWLKFICKRIHVKKIKIVGNNLKEKIDELQLEATNLIYKNLYINKLIIKINNFKLMFNYKNQLLYSNNMIINCNFKIDSSNLEKTFFKNQSYEISTYLEDELTEGKSITNLYINNDLININYKKDNLYLKRIFTLKEKDNLLFFEDVKNKKKVLLPLDKNIKVKRCLIKNELINIDLTSKVNFNN